MTIPNKRRFLSIDLRTLDSQTKEEHLDFNPSQLSTAELEKICKSVDTIKQQIFSELARRCGMLHRPVGVYTPPIITNKNGKKQVTPLNMQELAELAKLL